MANFHKTAHGRRLRCSRPVRVTPPMERSLTQSVTVEENRPICVAHASRLMWPGVHTTLPVSQIPSQSVS
eukprot:9977817-Alexandrium_andersonii.AAC.1